MTAPQSTPGDLVMAREEFDLCCYWEAMLTSDLECAYMSRDQDAKRRLERQIGVTSRMKHRAWDRLEALRRQAAPSFEALLADPTLQFDPNSEVLDSILAYGQQTVCMTRMEVRSNTASVGAVVPSSVYLCTKQKPCPDHPSVRTTGRDRS